MQHRRLWQVGDSSPAQAELSFSGTGSTSTQQLGSEQLANR
jgi:hypothetical protein